jgi:mono/diheme cytochrome c family protein
VLGQKILLAALLLFAASPLIPQAQAKSQAASSNSAQSQSQKKPVSSTAQSGQMQQVEPLVIPPSAEKVPNPEKPTAKSLASGKHRFDIDCAMCHGDDGSGNGFLAKTMKLSPPDFRDPKALKSTTDGGLFWVISNGHGPMLNEKNRASKTDIWDMVNYIRTFAEKKPSAKSK